MIAPKQTKPSVFSMGTSPQRGGSSHASVHTTPAQGVSPLVPAVLDSPGSALAEATRDKMGRCFEHDFSDVVVHTDRRAALSATAMNARAYTLGNQLTFADGEYEPETVRGQRLIAHELAHVVQQRQSGEPASRQIRRGSRNGPLEFEARSASNAVIAGLPISTMSAAPAGAIQCADQQESLGLLDSPLTEFVTGGLIGRTSFRVVRAGIHGVAEGLHDQPPERGQRIVARFKQLDSNLSDSLDFDLGFLKGIGQGLFDSAKGLIDLVLLLPSLGVQAAEWITSSGPSLFQNSDRLSAKAGEVKKSLNHALISGGKTLVQFVEHPLDALNAISTGLDQLELAALEQVSIAGRAVVDKVYAFLELPFDQFGQKLGYVTGMAAFEVLFAIATEGIGTALKEAATILSSGARTAVAEASRVLRLIIDVGGKAIRGLESFLKTAGKAIAAEVKELGAAIHKLFELLQDAVASLVPATEPELAAAGGSTVSGSVLLSKGEQIAGKGAGRTTTTTVEELTGRAQSVAEKPVPGGPRPGKAVQAEEFDQVGTRQARLDAPRAEKINPQQFKKMEQDIKAREASSLRRGDSRALGNNLHAAGNPPPGPGSEAHHIIPSDDPRAENLVNLLSKKDIDINRSENGIWLKKGPSEPTTGAITPHKFTQQDEYFERLKDIFAKGDKMSKEEILSKLRKIANDLDNGTFL